MVYQYKISFEEGLHSRPAIGLTDLCKEYEYLNIKIVKINNEEKNIKCKNLISILTANIAKNDIIEIQVTDSDDFTNNEIKNKLDKIFENKKDL